MSDLKEAYNKVKHALDKIQKKMPEKINIFRSKKRNSDPLLVPVQVENINPFPVFIERDTRFDDYVKHWTPLAPIKYVLHPSRNVILPNEYVTYRSPNKQMITLNKYYGSAMRD